jgi:hypothetical protein
MPHQTQLSADDPGRVGRYSVAGRIEGIPSDDPIYLGTAPDGTDVAISMLSGDWAHDAAARDRFAAEAAVARRVPPFCAARLLDSGVDGDLAYLVSEYIPGQSLLEVVSAEGVLSGPDLEAVAIGMATGLAAVHQAGLIHGHFGPEYVVLPPDGQLRVVEFAITPPYGTATPAADMYDWAQTVFYAATGSPPGELPVLSVLPEPIRTAVERSLHRDPVERPAARAVVLALLGDAIPAAGVLAEGSRRAVRRDSGRAGTRPAGPRGTASRPAATTRVPTAAGPAPRSGQRPADGQRHLAGRLTADRHTADRHLAGRRTADSQRTADPRSHPSPAGTGSPAGPPGQRQRPTAGQRGGDGAPPVTRQLPAVQPRDAGRSRRTGGKDARSGARPPHSGSHLQHSSRARRAWLAVGAVFVVAVIGGAAVLHLAQDSGSAPGSNSRHPRNTASTSPTTSTSSPGVAAPAAFAGSWHGTLHQPPGDTYTATVVFTAGVATGSVSYSGSDFSCTGTLTVTSASSATLGMSQKVSKPCGDSPVTVTLQSGGAALSFTIKGTSQQPSVTGTLHKS